MVESDIKKAFEVLKANGLNPTLFLTDSSESVSEAYYRILEEEKGRTKEPNGKYEIYCHQERQEGVHYIEDDFSQSGLLSLRGEDVLSFLEQNGNKLFCCYDVFLNRLGVLIACGEVFYKDFKIIYYDNGKKMFCKMTEEGYILEWPIGYFSHR